MASNDEVLWGLPMIQCPSCQFTLDTSGAKVEKYSKAQRATRHPDTYAFESHTEKACIQTVGKPRTLFDGEDQSSGFAENVFLVLSCGNERCEQYNKIKVLRMPRLHAPSVKVDLA